MSSKTNKFLSSLIASSLLCLSLTSVSMAATTTENAQPDTKASEETDAKIETKAEAAPEAEAKVEEADSSKLPSLAERTEQWGDASIATRAGAAAEALTGESYSAAIPNFRSLIGFDCKNVEFYIGLYYSAVKAEKWGQAYLAMEELFEQKPEMKKQLAKQFAEVLRKNDEEGEAKEVDKLVSKTSGDGTAFIEKTIKDFIEKSVFEKPKAKPIEEYKPPTRDDVEEDSVHLHRSKYGLTYLNMFQRSESIVLCEYKKFETDGSVSYFAPPKAIYHIEEYLKGPPHNPTLPVRFEFHSKVGENKPKDWKFSKDMMPKPGSKWIIFIENSVPIDGMYETYHGAFGRQEFNEDNYDKILRIIEKHKGQTR